VISPTGLDCTVLGDLFGTDEVRRAFDSVALVQSWLDAEKALAQAEAEAGVIPGSAAERIAAEADAAGFDLDALRAGVADSQHPLVPLIRALVERCGEAGAYVHWGATTQDIVDTGMALRARRALEPIRRDLDAAVTAAARLARAHAGDVMAGRTHGQHAVPITFGLKAASWVDELVRVRERLAGAERCLCAQLGGAAGTLATLGDRAAEIRRRYAAALGLPEAPVPWHVARDRVRDMAHALDQLGAAGERIAGEVVRLQAVEVGEAREPATPGHVGSSTMPQKRNPMTSEYLIASARLLHGTVTVVSTSAGHAGERDMGLWAAEWVALPQAFILAGGIAAKLAWVLTGLEVDTARMRANVNLTDGAIMAESVMMRLAAAIGHEPAHQAVAAAAARAAARGEPLAISLAADPVVSRHLDEDALSDLLDPEGYLGLAPEIAQSVAGEDAADAP
jgi:adenylosuccinate lyase/3-carboxy-cis,cis-muconate cycloisomerase